MEYSFKRIERLTNELSGVITRWQHFTSASVIFAGDRWGLRKWSLSDNRNRRFFRPLFGNLKFWKKVKQFAKKCSSCSLRAAVDLGPSLLYLLDAN
jgi:hypothetical protein